MHEHHDESLILDLIRESATEAEAESRLDGCERCLTEFTEQRSISEYLSGLESFTLSGSERSQLRTAVLSELDSNEVLVPFRSPVRRFDWARFDWARVGTVAAALVGVVAVGGLLSTMGDLGDESNQALDQAVTAAVPEDDAANDGDATAAFAVPREEESQADAAGAESDTADEEMTAAPSDLVIRLGSVDLPTFETELEQIREQITNTTESGATPPSDSELVSLACQNELDDPGSVRAIVTAQVDGLEVEVYFDNEGGEIGYASVDCSIFELP